MTRLSLDACTEGNRFLTSRQHFTKTKIVATETIREAKAHCTVQLSGRQNLTVWQRLERWSLILWPRPAPSNNPIQKACSISKTDALEEEGRDCLSFLSAYGVALQDCPPNALRDTHVPSPFAHREHVFGHCHVPSPPGIYY